MRRLLVSVTALAAVGALVGVALAAGPSPGVLMGGEGVVAPNGKTRYVTVTKGGATVVSAIQLSTAKTLRSSTISGVYGVPMITFNGLTGGLTPDGRTLVLGSNPYEKNSLATSSRFAVLDARTFRVRSLISLQGLFAFDAISPNGKTLYLVEHLLRSDQFRYRVRAYDLAAHKLVRHVVADPQEWADSMVGAPLARATGPGGRWVYTLYSAPGRPFIHALDAANRKAVCIDLPWKGTEEEFSYMRLSLNGDASRLLVRPEVGGTPVLVVDTKTLRVVSSP
jgi:DNA-binding beta-propeller fold protein YncE